MKLKRIPEIRMFYNVQDNRYYIYFGEDYICDTQNETYAIQMFQEQCFKLKNNKGV